MPASPETLKRVEEALEAARMVPPFAKVLRVVMEARGIPLSEEGRTHLERCYDPEKVQQWIRRAATATTEAEVFEGEPPPS